MKLDEVQAMCRIYIEAGVMNPNMTVLACMGKGDYPILLLHENIKKHVNAEKLKVFEQYSVDWFLKQNPSIELKGIENTCDIAAILEFFNTNVYVKEFAAKDDPDLWRLDAILPLCDDNETLGVVKINDIDGFGISSLGKRKTIFSVFGKAKKIVKLLEQQIS